MEAQPVTPAAPAAAPAPAMSANNAPAAPAAASANAPLSSEGLTATVEQPAGSAGNEAPQGMGSTWLIAIVIGVWVLFLYSTRKNSKKQQQQRQDELNSLAKGARVVTIGRIHGVVVSTTETTFTLKTDPNKENTLTFDREALLRIIKDGDGGEKKN